MVNASKAAVFLVNWRKRCGFSRPSDSAGGGVLVWPVAMVHELYQQH